MLSTSDEVWAIHVQERWACLHHVTRALSKFTYLQDHLAAKRKRAAKFKGGNLAFLPEPQNPIPVKDDPAPEPDSCAQATSTVDLFPTAETAEIYRMQDADTAPQSAAPQSAGTGLTTQCALVPSSWL
jgi:hypothetical protein